MTLFLFQSASIVMTHTLDPPGRYQASNLVYSPPSWVFRELLRKGGVDMPLSLEPLQEPSTANFHCLLVIPDLGG